jgi:hypothetical protein
MTLFMSSFLSKLQRNPGKTLGYDDEALRRLLDPPTVSESA